MSHTKSGSDRLVGKGTARPHPWARSHCGPTRADMPRSDEERSHRSPARSWLTAATWGDDRRGRLILARETLSYLRSAAGQRLDACWPVCSSRPGCGPPTGAYTPLGCAAASSPGDRTANLVWHALEHPVPAAPARDRDPGCTADAPTVLNSGDRRPRCRRGAVIRSAPRRGRRRRGSGGHRQLDPIPPKWFPAPP
jgi:hypothetical protein